MWFNPRVALALVAGATLQAQVALPSARETAARAHAAMADSLERQKQSVAEQVRATRVVESFERPLAPVAAPARFTLGYSRPVGWPGATGLCAPVSPVSLNPEIESAAQQQSLPADLLRAVIATESAYVPCAVSPKGAAGLMQLMPATAQTFGVTNPLDPGQSIGAGAKYLSQLLARYGGDLRLALGAYNAGPALVDKYGEVPPILETQQYVRKILSEPGVESFSRPSPIR
jgi:soluble lytic murein transglycosylase-like protein